MSKHRKNVVILAAAVALMTASTASFAFPPGYGPGGGPGMMGGGPGMMGWGGGPGMMGRGGGPGMMGGPGMGPRGGWGPGAGAGPAAHVDARLAYLRSELKITGEQDAAWQAYANQMKQQAESMQALFAQPAAAAQTAPERATQRAQFAKQRAAAMEANSTALKNLYAALTPEQKAIVDSQFGGPRMGHGPRGYGRWR